MNWYFHQPKFSIDIYPSFTHGTDLGPELIFSDQKSRTIISDFFPSLIEITWKMSKSDIGLELIISDPN